MKSIKNQTKRLNKHKSLHELVTMCLTFTDTKKCWLANYLSVFPVGDAWRNLPLLLLLDCHLQQKRRNSVKHNNLWTIQATSFWLFNKTVLSTENLNVLNISANCTFLLGECITGAGGEGGPRGIFLLILKHTIIPSNFLIYQIAGAGTHRYWRFSTRKIVKKDSYKLSPGKIKFSFDILVKTTSL